jgi:hypothetical protein
LGVALALGACGGGDADGETDAAEESDDGPVSDEYSEERPATPAGCGDAVYDGSVYLERGPQELEKIAGVGTITGHLVIDKTGITSLDGFECIVEVGRDVHIFGNQSLTDLRGMDNLWRVRGNVIVAENGAITDFDAFPGLMFVGERAAPASVVVRNMDAMTDMTGFSALREIEGDLYVQFNNQLRGMDGMRALRFVFGIFAVTHNAKLCITSINGVGEGLAESPEPGSTTIANDNGC